MNSKYVITRYGIDIDLRKEGHTGCPKCISKGRDNSRNNMMCYGLDEDGEYLGCKCFSCDYVIPSEKWLRENGESNWNYLEEDLMGLEFNEEILQEIKNEYEFISEPYRGIHSEIYKYFGVMHKVDEDGELIEQIYPTFVGANISGFKRRGIPKQFLTPYGKTGADVDFFGQFRFLKHTGRDVVITCGEIDALSAYQMLKTYTDRTNKIKGTDYPCPPVVCSTIGELGTPAQARNNYEWLDGFDRIIYFPDQDAAGLEAVEKLADAVPLGKLYIATLPLKDCNDMLVAGKEKEFINAFFKAKPFAPEGVKSAAEAFDEIEDELSKERITLPPYMYKLQDMMGGGIIQGRIANVIAFTSSGKSTHVNRIVHHAIFNSPVVPTIVSLEATGGQYLLEMLSIHMQQNLRWKMSDEELKDFIKTEEGQALKRELCFKEDGTARFYLIDDRQGSIQSLEEQLEKLHQKYNSKLFIIDVLSDLLRGSSEQHSEDHMNFQRNMAKNGVTFINVLHTRKPANTQDGGERKVTEYDALGTGSFVQSAAYNIVLNRDKLAQDELVKNSTVVDLPKCRGGKTGPAGVWYYDFPTVTCYDYDDYLQNNPDLVNFE